MCSLVSYRTTEALRSWAVDDTGVVRALQAVMLPTVRAPMRAQCRSYPWQSGVTLETSPGLETWPDSAGERTELRSCIEPEEHQCARLGIFAFGLGLDDLHVSKFCSPPPCHDLPPLIDHSL